MKTCSKLSERFSLTVSHQVPLCDDEDSHALAAALEAVKLPSVAELSDGSDSEAAHASYLDHPSKKHFAARGNSERKRFVKTGKVSFKTRYIPEEKRLEVLLVRAFDLGQSKELGEVNPFIRLYLLPGKKQKQSTKVKKRTKEPYFNEKRVFYDISGEDKTSHRLKLKVYSAEAITRNELLGETEIALNSLRCNEDESFCFDLFMSKNKVCL